MSYTAGKNERKPSPSEVEVRSYIRKKPKATNGKSRVDKQQKKMPSMDVPTVKLIHSLLEESIKENKEKNRTNPNPSICAASEAWGKVWAKKKRRKKPEYRSVAKARKIEKEVNEYRRLNPNPKEIEEIYRRLETIDAKAKQKQREIDEEYRRLEVFYRRLETDEAKAKQKQREIDEEYRRLEMFDL